MTEVRGLESLEGRLEHAFQELDIYTDDGLDCAAESLVGKRFMLTYNEPGSQEASYIAGTIEAIVLDGNHFVLTAAHYRFHSISFSRCNDGYWMIADGETHTKRKCEANFVLLN